MLESIKTLRVDNPNGAIFHDKGHTISRGHAKGCSDIFRNSNLAFCHDLCVIDQCCRFGYSAYLHLKSREVGIPYFYYTQIA